MKKEKTIKTYQRRTKSGKLTTVKQHTARYDAAEAAKEALKKAKGAGREFEKGGTILTELDKLLKAAEDMTLKGPEVYSSDKWMEHNSKIQKYIQKNNISEAQFNKVAKKYGLDVNYEGYVPQSKKDPITKSAKDKAEAHSKSLKAPGFEKPPKTATKPVNGKGKSEKSAPTISPEDYKAWYHWDQEKDPKNKAALSVEKALKAKMGTKEYNKYFNKVSDEYSSRGHLKGYKSLEPAEHSKIKSAKMRTGTAKAQKEIAEKMGAKDAAAKFDKIAKEGKAKGKEPFEVFGGVHTKAQMDKIQKDMAEWKTVGGIKKHIDELKKQGHDKKGHTEHPHYLWAVKKLKEMQGGSKSTISVKVNGKDVSVPKSNGEEGKSPTEKKQFYMNSFGYSSDKKVSDQIQKGKKNQKPFDFEKANPHLAKKEAPVKREGSSFSKPEINELRGYVRTRYSKEGPFSGRAIEEAFKGVSKKALKQMSITEKARHLVNFTAPKK